MSIHSSFQLLHSLVHSRYRFRVGSEPATNHAALIDARRSIGVYQHHDAVTGTAKTHVNADYGQMLHHARHGTLAVMRMALESLLRADGDALLRGASLDERGWLAATENERRHPEQLPHQLALAIPIADDETLRAVVVFNPLVSERRQRRGLCLSSRLCQPIERVEVSFVALK